MSFSQSLTAAGVSQRTSVQPGQSVTYSVTGTFTGYVDVRIASGGGANTVLAAPAVDTGCSGTYKNESNSATWLYFSAFDTDAETAMTGTAVCAATDVAKVLSLNTNDAGATVMALEEDALSLRVPIENTYGVGTAAAGVTVAEYGDGFLHVTRLTVNTTLGAIAGGANLALGKLLYTLPAGAQVIDRSYFSLAITQTDGNITADTPYVCLGTVVASGVVNTLAGTATFYNVGVAQKAATDCDGTATTQTNVCAVVREAADAKTIYANVADGWAASGDAAAKLTGTVVLRWTQMS